MKLDKLENIIEDLKKENAELKRKIEVRYTEKNIHRIITYESDWVLTDFWLPIAVVFSIASFVISIYVYCTR